MFCFHFETQTKNKPNMLPLKLDFVLIQPAFVVLVPFHSVLFVVPKLAVIGLYAVSSLHVASSLFASIIALVVAAAVRLTVVFVLVLVASFVDIASIAHDWYDCVANESFLVVKLALFQMHPCFGLARALVNKRIVAWINDRHKI